MTVKDPLNHTWTLTYDGPDLATIKNPLNQTTTRYSGENKFMSQRVSWQGVVASIIGAAVVMVLIYDVPRLIISWMGSGRVGAHRDELVTAALAVFGAAIATRHWLAPTLLAAAFLLLPVLGLLPTKSAQGSRLLMVGATALAILSIFVGLLLASLVLIVRGLIRNLPRRS